MVRPEALPKFSWGDQRWTRGSYTRAGVLEMFYFTHMLPGDEVGATRVE